MPDVAFDPVADARRKLGVSALEAQVMFWLTSATLFVVLIANQLHIETDDAVKLARVPELAIRLLGTAVGGLLGVYGVLFMGRVRASLFRFPAAWMMGVAVCYVLATLTAGEKGVALPHLVIFVCVLLFTPTALAVLGNRRFFEIALLALVVNLLASWFLYLFLPQYGVKLEGVDEFGGTMRRMSGTSHPNTIAGMAGFAILITLGFHSANKMNGKLALTLVLFCGLTLVFCRTRVAPIAVFLSLLIVYRNVWFRRDLFPLTLGLVGILIATLLAGFLMARGIPELIADRFARSGEVEEITSVTGRNEIWAFTFEQIADSPLVGYGPGAAKAIYEQQEMLLHPHNVVLAVTMASGLMGGLFVILMFGQQVFMSLRGGIPLIALITLFIFFNSLTETFIFGYFPGSSTMLWLAAIFSWSLDDGSLTKSSLAETK